MTSIEHLSNELFYEIFDYLDGCDIYQAFSNLNHHFQQLLNSSFLLFKIKDRCSIAEDVFMNNWNQMSCLNRQQICSIHLWMSSYINEFFSSLFIIDSSLNHLESLVLCELEPDILMSVLVKLTSLPRLFSLTIDMFNVLIDLTDIYRLVFTLPMLKYYKFLIGHTDLSVSLPMPTNQQFSTIKNLVIDHCCTFNELSTVVSYTPQLRRLRFTHDLDGNLNIGIISSITLSNLTHLSIHVYNVRFDEFEIFISKIYSKLNVLCVITQNQDITYLDAHRWEKLILQYTSQLEKFDLQYYEYIGDDFIFSTYPGELNQFTSSFWIERRWLLETEIDYEHIIYSIRSYKKRWYEYTQQNIDNSSVELSKSNRLNIMDMPVVDSYELIIIHIKRILNIALIYHLEISEEKTFIGILIRIIDLLPELNSLKIHSISFNQPRTLCIEELDIVCSTLYTSKITKVYLEKMNYIEDVFFLMIFCPRMIYLKVDYINNMDIELFLRNILKKIKDECNKHFRLLCFRVPAADDQMIKTLQKMINDDKLLIDYTIKRILDNIYLQWK